MPTRSEIYAAFYGLEGRPFHVTADPRSLYLGDGHKEGLAAIVHGVRAGKGFIVLTGEVGVGKTTVLRAALDHIGDEEVKLVYIAYPQISVAELLRQISEMLGGPAEGEIDVGRLLSLLIDYYRRGVTVAVVIDEAQRVSTDVLETLRLLSNFETDDDKLVQTILVGQPELEDVLRRHDMRQFRSRVALWVRIKPLTPAASHAYVMHRIANVGGDARRLFSSSALRYLIREADGYPRSLNIYCDNALLTGYGYQARKITRAIAEDAIADFRGEPDTRFRRRLIFGTSVAGAVALVATASLGFVEHHDGRLAAGVASAVTSAVQAATAAPSLLLRRAPSAPPSDAAPAPAASPTRTSPHAAIPQAIPPVAAAMPATVAPIALTAVDAPQTPAVPEPGASQPASDVPDIQPETAAGAPRFAAKPRADAITRVTVRRGDSLDGLAIRIYGRKGNDITAALRRRNKGLDDPNHLKVGQELVFPTLAALQGEHTASAP